MLWTILSWWRSIKRMEWILSPADCGDRDGGPEASYLGMKLTLRVVDRCRGRLCGSMIVRMDAGFPEPGLLRGWSREACPISARIVDLKMNSK